MRTKTLWLFAGLIGFALSGCSGGTTSKTKKKDLGTQYRLDKGTGKNNQPVKKNKDGGVADQGEEPPTEDDMFVSEESDAMVPDSEVLVEQKDQGVPDKGIPDQRVLVPDKGIPDQKKIIPDQKPVIVGETCNQVFTYDGKEQMLSKVELHSSYGHWKTGIPMTRSGNVWKTTVKLPKGKKVEYKFVLYSMTGILTDYQGPLWVSDQNSAYTPTPGENSIRNNDEDCNGPVKPTERCNADGYCTIKAAGKSFQMGSSDSDMCHYKDTIKGIDYESLHTVTLKYDFIIGQTEVTNEQFQNVMGGPPEEPLEKDDPQNPVRKLTWSEAIGYCNTLSTKENLKPCYTAMDKNGASTWNTVTDYAGDKIYECPGYRLPTEAEWEYAYRAGSTTPFYSGGYFCTASGKDLTVCSISVIPDAAGSIAWYKLNSGGAAHKVKGKEPNAWELYDMAGNVWEWVHDGWKESLGKDPVTNPVTPWGDDDKRVKRGGSFSTKTFQGIRGAYRDASKFTYKGSEIGFRCVKTIFPKN